MNIQFIERTFFQNAFKNSSFIIVSIALFSGLVLSIMSALELCVEHCAANQDYRLFGFPFAFIGIAFFTIIFCLHLLSSRSEYFSKFVIWGLALAFGSEIVFILVQKNEIGRWCPVCLSIAAAVCIAGFVLSIDYFKNLITDIKNKDRSQIMFQLKKGLMTCSLMVLGFLMSFTGISKIDASQVAQEELKKQIVMGNKNSDIDVYFFSDWFCPSCKKVEPIIEKIYPKIQSQVAFYFIDYPIHKMSLNYAPYNLALLVNSRPQYFQGRKILMDLAEKNEKPTDTDVDKVMHAKGIMIKELPNSDVMTSKELSDKLIEKFNLNATPTIVIANKKGSTIKLEGRDEISEDSILESIKKLQKK